MGHWTENQDPTIAILVPWPEPYGKWVGWTEKEGAPTFQFKIIHRLHYTKTILHRPFPDVSPFCYKCQTDVATPLHSNVLCSKWILD